MLWSGLNGRTERGKVDQNKLVKTRRNIKNDRDDGSRAPEVEKNALETVEE